MAVEIKIRPERSKPLVTENATFRSLYDFELTDKDLEQAQSELGETEEVKKKCLIKLKKMLTGTAAPYPSSIVRSVGRYIPRQFLPKYHRMSR